MNKLSHSIDDILTNDFHNCDVDDIRKIITDYDSLNESMLFVYPTRIKTKIIKRFKNFKTLPNNLSYDLSPCETPNDSKRHSPNDSKRHSPNENDIEQKKINSIKNIYNNNLTEIVHSDIVHSDIVHV